MNKNYDKETNSFLPPSDFTNKSNNLYRLFNSNWRCRVCNTLNTDTICKKCGTTKNQQRD